MLERVKKRFGLRRLREASSKGFELAFSHFPFTPLQKTVISAPNEPIEKKKNCGVMLFLGLTKFDMGPGEWAFQSKRLSFQYLATSPLV